MAERLKYQFKSVQLLKDQSLGIGSYGTVCKAKCDDLVCAAKIIHPTLFDPTALHQIASQRKHTLPIRHFEQECEFMSAIRHPNIVQYLGMFRDADIHLPVLLVELMDDSLTHFLEGTIQPISYYIQVNICHDITLALSFLHSNNIVHGDLSSNNILLHGNILAKVTDFGMTRLGSINPQATHFTSTMCPGTDVYMPPETVQDKAVYTERSDCFSLGVIIVQILTRQFPNPGNQLQRIELSHPGLPMGSVLVPEVNRRQNHISQIDPNHFLLPIALDCLKDKGSECPSAHQLCKRVADLKEMPTYIESARAVRNVEDSEVLQSLVLTTQLEENERAILAKEEENQLLRQQIQEKDELNRQLQERERHLLQELRELQVEKDQVLRESIRQIEEKDRQLGHVNQQLESCEKAVIQFERRIAELEQYLSQREQQNTRVNSREKELTSFKQEQQNPKACHREKELTSFKQEQLSGPKVSSRENELTSCFKLRWREGKRAPCRMSRWCDAIVDGNTVYVINGGSVKMYAYDVTSDSWSQLPDCVHEDSSITILNGWVTTVGGSSLWYCSNELFSLNGEDSSRRWTKKFPPMPTKRQWTTSLCTVNTLIVAGGSGEDDRVLSVVEVMNTETHQWSTAADLPEPMCTRSATICGDRIYMLGGVGFAMMTNIPSLYIPVPYVISYIQLQVHS